MPDEGAAKMKNKIVFILYLLFGTYICSTAKAEDFDNLSSKEVSLTNNIENTTNQTVNSSNNLNLEVTEHTFTIDELKEKADNGDVQSQLDLGYIFLYGKNGTNIDYKQAMHYYELAAQNKNPVALNNLGSLYFNGIGTDVDHVKAIYYFEEAAKLGSNDAALNLAIISLGDNKKEKSIDDWKKIYSLLNQAQEDNVFARYLFGYAHSVGFLVKKDLKKSFKLIKSAADDNYDEAQYILSDFYILGKGTVKNYNQAIKYLELASEQGHKDAMMKLADIFNEGKIYNKNINKAYILYNVIAVLGDETAAKKRDEIEQQLSMENLLSVQASAENYVEKPSDETLFARKTFGKSLKAYIDINLKNAMDINLTTDKL